MKKFRHIRFVVLTQLLFISTGSIIAQTAAVTSPIAEQEVINNSPYSSALFYVLASIALLLLIFIRQLAIILSTVAANHARNKTGASGSNVILVLVFCGLLIPSGAKAEGSISEFLHEGFGSTAINALVFIILFELLVVLYYARLIHSFTKKEAAEIPYVEKPKKTSSFWTKFNRSVEIHHEEAIMFEHSYDGIRELDNSLPPWWRYGFYLTIIFSIVYMLHYHVVKTGKLSIAEYDQEMKQAELAIAEYRRNAANFVDESNVVILTEESDINSGRAIFMEKCALCHGKTGEGQVGPNLTDQYWLHGGDIKSVFSVIKYGVTAKGMQSWKEMLGARQIAQAASYILTLQGTNPPNPKAPQGEIYIPPVSKEEGDSTSTNPDSTKTLPADTLLVKNIAEVILEERR